MDQFTNQNQSFDDNEEEPFENRYIDEHGFFQETKSLSSKQPPLTPLLLKKWADILNVQSASSQRDTKILCRRGIPQSVRGKVWVYLTKSKDIPYNSLSPIHSQTHSAIFEAIDCDVNRCYPGNS